MAGAERKKKNPAVNEEKGKARSMSHRLRKEAGLLCKGNGKSPESLEGKHALTHTPLTHSNQLMLLPGLWKHVHL